MPVSSDQLVGLLAAPYSRVSNSRGKEGRSTGEQDAENVVTCERYGMPIFHSPTTGLLFTDDNRPASKWARKEREDWKELLDCADAGAFKVLVVWEPSRATRDRLVWAAVGAMCQEREIYICASGTVYDPNDPDDMFQLDLYFALAVRESGVTQKRVNRTIRASALAGRPHGALTYGYRREYEVTATGTKRVIGQEPDGVKSEIVTEVFTRWARGEGATAIARDLEGRRIRPPRGTMWRHTTILRMLDNPSYIGQRSLKGEVTAEHAWTPIISDDLWWGARARRDDPERPGLYDSTVKHLLSAIAVCGRCQGKIGGRPTGQGQYVCRTKYCVARAAPALDAYVTEAVLALHEDDDRLKSDADDPKIGVLNGELGTLRQRLNAFVDSAGTAQGPSPAAVARIEAQLLPQIAAKERQLSGLRARVRLPELTMPLRSAWLLPESAGGLTLLTKRQIIRATARIEIQPIGHGVVLEGNPGVVITPTWEFPEEQA